MLLPGDCNGPSVTVTAPDGVDISDGAITGNYDTATSFPLTLNAIGGAEITGVTIDDVAATITEGVVNIPYTAAKMVVSGTAVTVHGTETIEDEYTIDVERIAVRPFVRTSTVSVDQINKTITGIVNSKQVVIYLRYSGSIIAYSNRTRGLFKIYQNGVWSDYRQVNLNSNGMGVTVRTSDDIKLQFKYTTPAGAEFESQIFDIDLTTESIVEDETVVLISETEGVVIDTEAHTVSGTFATGTSITLAAKFTDSELGVCNLYLFYPPVKGLLYKSATSDSLDITADNIQYCDTISAYVVDESGNRVWAPDYTVNITLTE